MSNKVVTMSSVHRQRKKGHVHVPIVSETTETPIEEASNNRKWNVEELSSMYTTRPTLTKFVREYLNDYDISEEGKYNDSI